jgi:hypothetical protein
MGTSGCQGSYYKANFDSDGADIALLANTYGLIVLDGTAVVGFAPVLPRAYLFRLTVSGNGQSSSESTIVGGYHPNAA